MTPDGPRGPAEEVKGGTVELASLSGAAIVPTSFFCKPLWRVSSWDRTIVPRGYGKGIVMFAPPIEVPSKCNREELEAKRVEVENSLAELTQRTEHYWNQSDTVQPQELKQD